MKEKLGNGDKLPAYPVAGIFITNKIHAVCNILEHGALGRPVFLDAGKRILTYSVTQLPPY
jgi:hypothetical protein